MTQPRKLSVFLCHAQADIASARDLYKRLITRSWIDPWLGEEKILPGHNPNAEIAQAIENADAIIVNLSQRVINEEGSVQRELKLAQTSRQNKPDGEIYILPLRLDDCQLPPSLKDLHAVDYFPKGIRARTFEALLESLKIKANKLGIQVEETEPPIQTPKPEPRQRGKTDAVMAQKFEYDFQKPVESTANFPLRVIPFKENDNFTGRVEILSLIHQEFMRRQKRVPAYAVTGLGGIGKTQTAVAYCYNHLDEYDLIWWIRSETQASISADYQALSDALQLPLKSAAEQSVYVNLVNNWLENTEKKWLLVYDNAEKKEDIEPLLPDGGNGHVLITSQNPDWRSIAKHSHIPLFSEEEAREFFSKRIGEQSTAHADQLAELLGDLPLAMEQACAYMTQRGITIEIYMGLFEEQRQQLWKFETAPKGYKATVATTWKMAFQQIRQIEPVAEELLTLFAFFAPDDIPISMLQTYSKQLPPNIAKIVNSPLELVECLMVLYRYSLISRDGDLISMHRLVQDVVRDSLKEGDLKKWLSIALQIVEKAFPYDENDLATWSQCASTLPHALATADHAETYSIDLELAADLYQKTAEYYEVQGEYDKAEGILQHAIDIRRELFGEQHGKLAESLDFLGRIYAEKARYDDALKLHLQAFSILKASSNAEIKSIARNLNNLGRVLDEQGNFENARSYYEEALAISRNELRENHPDTGSILNNIGLLLYHEGDYENVGKYYQEVQAIHYKTLGDNHPKIATALNNLALLSDVQGDFESARKYFEESLSMKRKTLGGNHPNTAITLNNFGDFLGSQGDFENAEKCFEETLVILRRTLGNNHPDIGHSLNSIGRLLSMQSKYVEARLYLEQGLTIFQKAYGIKHYRLIGILSNLATTMAHLGLYPQARKYAAQAMKICAEAKEKYVECDGIEQLQKIVPMIGKKKQG